MSQHRRQCLAGLRLLAITSGTAVVRGILSIASNPRASSPRLVTDGRGVEVGDAAKRHQLLG